MRATERLSAERVVDVTLPPAVDEGDTVTVPGAGGPGVVADGRATFSCS